MKVNPRTWSRRRKLTVAGSAAAVMLTGAAVAVAMVVLRAPIKGGGDIQGIPPEVTITAVARASGTTTDCTVTQPDTVQMPDTAPGQFCNLMFTVVVEDGNLEPMRLQDVEFADVTVDTFRSPTVCGQTIPADTETPIHVRFLVPSGASPQTFQAGAEAGITVADDEAFTTANCP